MDKDSKLITAFEVTVVNVHDSQVLPNVLSSPEDGGAAVYANSAVQSDDIDGIVFAKGLDNQIHDKAHRNKPLTTAQITNNKPKSRKRSRF